MKKFGICLLALTMAVLLAAPAMAAGITPYASMRLGTYWVNHDFNDFDPGWTTDDDDSSFMIDIADISRFGAKGQAGDIYGVVELGLIGQENANEYTWAGVGENSATLDVYTRLIYGKWDFGAGTLLVGQDYAPVTYISNQQGPGIFDDEANTSYDLQNAFIGVGTLWDSRIPQIKVNLDNGFYCMVAQVDHAANPQGATAGGDVDLILPKTVVGFDIKREGLYLGPGLAYNSYNYDDGVGGFSDDITSWFFFLHGKVDLGATTLKFTGHYGENVGDWVSCRKNRYDATLDASRAYVNGTDVDNATCYGGWVQAAFALDPGTLSLGWGYSSSQNDTTAVADYDEKDELMGVFVNYKIPITDNFSATPEFDYWDGMDSANGAKDPDHWALGVTWQMDF